MTGQLEGETTMISPSSPTKASAEMLAQEADSFAEDEETGLPPGEWMCVHHGTGGGPGEDCPDCREHWGLDPVRPQ